METLLRYGGRRASSRGSRLRWLRYACSYRLLCWTWATRPERNFERAGGSGEGLGTRGRSSDASADQTAFQGNRPSGLRPLELTAALRACAEAAASALLASQAGAGLAASRRPFCSMAWLCTEPPSMETWRLSFPIAETCKAGYSGGQVNQVYIPLTTSSSREKGYPAEKRNYWNTVNCFNTRPGGDRSPAANPRGP